MTEAGECSCISVPFNWVDGGGMKDDSAEIRSLVFSAGGMSSSGMRRGSPFDVVHPELCKGSEFLL